MSMKNGAYCITKVPDDFPGKRYRGVYVYEHIFVWWQNTKIVPPPGYIIHHKNGQKHDNRFENLEMVFKITHLKMHNAHNRAETILLVCDGCNKPFSLLKHRYKHRRKVGLIYSYCSNKCQLSVINTSEYRRKLSKLSAAA